MWSEALNIAISNGIFAVLFVSLLLYLLKDSSAREKKYQAMIESLNKHLGIVEDIDEKTKEIYTAVIVKKKQKRINENIKVENV